MKIFVPTRNRPNSLNSLLGYLLAFYPRTSLLIADGSNGEQKSRVREVISSFADLDIQFEDYPYEIGYVDRCIDAIGKSDTDTLVPCADDDYPLVDVLQQASQILARNSDANAVLAASVMLRPLNNKLLAAKLSICQPLKARTIEGRLRAYGRLHNFTYYGAIRSVHLRARLEHFRDDIVPGFGDFEVAFLDAVAGKVIALPAVGYLRTHNPNHSKLRGADGVFDGLYSYARLVERLGVALAKADPSMGQEEIKRLVTRSIVRFASTKVFRPAIAEFGRSEVFGSPEVSGQIDCFDRLFDAGSGVQSPYSQQLRWAADSLYESKISEDNRGEPRTYGSIESMSREIDL